MIAFVVAQINLQVLALPFRNVKHFPSPFIPPGYRLLLAKPPKFVPGWVSPASAAGSGGPAQPQAGLCSPIASPSAHPVAPLP